MGGKGDGDYTPMTSALRWAAMRAVLMFHNCEGQSHELRQCSQTTTFEEKGEPKQIRTEVSAYQPNALALGQTDSLRRRMVDVLLYVQQKP